MKKALVLAGGIAQAALIEELRCRGYYVLLADMNPNCYAASLADEFHEISAMDLEALETLAREQNVDLVMTACADQILLANGFDGAETGEHAAENFIRCDRSRFPAMCGVQKRVP